MTDDHQELDKPVVIGMLDYTSKHGGSPVEVEVTRDGRFRAKLGEVDLDTDNLGTLRRQIDDTVYGHRINVPFVNVNGVRGVMRGFHASQRKVLVTWEDGEKGTLSGHERVYPDGALTDSEVDILRALRLEVAKLRAQINALEEDQTERPEKILADAIGTDLFNFRRHDQDGV